MTDQLPLLEPPGSSLPGPQFIPRPGWGGQLKRWFAKNIHRIIFRFVILCALILIARSFWMNLPARNVLLTTPTSTPTATPEQVRGLTLKAQPGNGMTDLAARALDLYLAVQSRGTRLDAAQHLFAVDTLARSVCWCPLEVGAEVAFTRSQLESAIAQALDLAPPVHAAWERLLR